jgi:Flp pilus assembly protein TadB
VDIPTISSSDLATFIVPALLVLGGGTFVFLLLAPLVTHWRWARERRRRHGWHT